MEISSNMSKLIPLTQGKYAIVDDSDYEELSKYKWYLDKFYAKRNIRVGCGKQKAVKMHRLINNTPSGFETDHINGDKLDNRKCNLRTATTAQNRCNRGKQIDNKSGYKGVVFVSKYNNWQASIKINGKRKHLGTFRTPELAHAAYCEAAPKVHKEFARFV